MREVSLCKRKDNTVCGVEYLLGDNSKYSAYLGSGLDSDAIIEFVLLEMYSISEPGMMLKIPILYSNLSYEMENREDYYVALRNLTKRREKLRSEMLLLRTSTHANEDATKFKEQQDTAIRYKINTIKRKLGIL